MRTRTEIFDAIEAGDLDRVRELVAADPDTALARDEEGLSAVMQARYHGHSEIVDLILTLDPELNVFEAAAVGDAERVRILIGGDTDVARSWSPDGFTPLHFACFFGHPNIAEFLLERGAEVNAVAHNDLAVTPLQSAAAGGHTRAAELLLNAGADVHPAHPLGFTPLHSAAANGDRATAELLLDHGADPARAKNDGRTPIDLAAENGHDEIVALLGERPVG
jgi:ankyrin repeat protein